MQVHAPVAQRIERFASDEEAPGSIPGGRTRKEKSLTFLSWCSILKIVRTVFAAAGGEEIPPRKFGEAAKPHRPKPQKNPEKNIGSNHILILGEEIFYKS